MKSLTKEEIITLANKHCLPVSAPVVWEFVEYGLLEFVADLLRLATNKANNVEQVGGVQ